MKEITLMNDNVLLDLGEAVGGESSGYEEVSPGGIVTLRAAQSTIAMIDEGVVVSVGPGLSSNTIGGKRHPMYVVKGDRVKLVQGAIQAGSVQEIDGRRYGIVQQRDIIGVLE